MWQFIGGVFVGFGVSLILFGLLNMAGCSSCEDHWKKVVEYYRTKGAIHGN